MRKDLQLLHLLHTLLLHHSSGSISAMTRPRPQPRRTHIPFNWSPTPSPPLQDHIRIPPTSVARKPAGRPPGSRNRPRVELQWHSYLPSASRTITERGKRRAFGITTFGTNVNSTATTARRVRAHPSLPRNFTIINNQQRSRGRPRKLPAQPAPVSHTITVYYDGRLTRDDQGNVRYLGGGRAFIHLVDKNENFDFTELCRALFGRIVHPKEDSLIFMGPITEWSLPAPPIRIRPIENTHDVARMLDGNYDVYYQEDAFKPTIIGGVPNTNYIIPQEVYGRWSSKKILNWESRWQEILRRERREIDMFNFGIPKPWHVSNCSNPRPYHFRTLQDPDREWFDRQCSIPL